MVAIDQVPNPDTTFKFLRKKTVQTVGSKRLYLCRENTYI